ncbi:MAG: RHS repeat-associated core domain-containing protein, partial [Verrucomicrobiaceae bacterium]|nr:RHS repeat-associated core domain-containing protein [Verrucomicrobiaceae bacterium]
PPVHEVLVHDEDGNLRRDARWQYHWDAENRLVMMEERPGIATYPSGAGDAPARQRLEFFYDAQSRRSAKRVFHWDAVANDWKPWAYTLFLYDGWNVVAELDLLNGGTPTRTYTWGTDLSNTMAGAGGVGGLLMVKRWQRNANGDASLRALVHNDANGNVMGLYGIEAQAMLGVFDYDAFGNQVINTVAMGNDVCPIGFSSKYQDKETGLVYYGFRYYSPEMGRWPNRDPIGERGGVNLYGMVGNDAVNRVDRLGLACAATQALPSNLTDALGDAWKDSFNPDGTVNEQGGSLIGTGSGTEPRPGSGGGSGSFPQENYPQPGSGETLDGTYHTHPYSPAEGGHKNVSFSCGDIQNFAAGTQGGQKVVMAGDSIFILTIGDQAKLKNCKLCCGKWNQGFGSNPKDSFQDRVEAGVQAAIKECGLCYYKATRGGNGKWPKSATLQN